MILKGCIWDGGMGRIGDECGSRVDCLSSCTQFIVEGQRSKGPLGE